MSLAPISVSASRAALALGSPDFRPASRAAAPWPPVLAIGLAVEHALARDRQLLLTVGVNQGRVVQQLGSFPARADKWQVELWVSGINLIVAPSGTCRLEVVFT